MAKRNLIEFYSNYIAELLSGGELVNRVKLSSLGIKTLYNRIVTRRFIKKIFCITSIPVTYQESLTEALQYRVFKTDPRAKMFVNMYSIPTKIDTTSDVFRRQMASSEEALNSYRNFYDDMTSTEKTIGKKVYVGVGKSVRLSKRQLDNLTDTFDSFKYVNDVTKNGGKLSNTFLFVEIMAPDEKVLKKVRREVADYLDQNEFRYSELSANSSNFMSNYCPATYQREFNNKEFIDVLLSDENMSVIDPFLTQGFIGDGTGALIGINANSKTPFILNFYETGDRQVNLYYAPSGKGKTVMAYQTILSLIASDVHCSYLDVKGDEGEKLQAFVPLTKIDISEESNSYVSTFRLDDVEPQNIEEALEYFNTARTASIELIKLATCKENETHAEEKAAIATQIVDKLFSQFNVSGRIIKSFKYTANIEYSMLIPILDEIRTSRSMEQNQEIITEMKNFLVDVFVQGNMFKGKEITLKDILESPLVVYSLNRNKNQVLTKEDKLRTFMITYLDTKKIAIRKSKGEFSAEFFEEMQRKDEFSSLIRFIAGQVTGARSSNVSVFLLCNSIAVLNSEEMRPITSNISSYFIGPIENEQDYDVLEQLNCSSIISKVRKISENQRRFANHFAVKYNTGKVEGSTVIKCVLPDEILNMIKTRDYKS